MVHILSPLWLTNLFVKQRIIKKFYITLWPPTGNLWSTSNSQLTWPSERPCVINHALGPRSTSFHLGGLFCRHFFVRVSKKPYYCRFLLLCVSTKFERPFLSWFCLLPCNLIFVLCHLPLSFVCLNLWYRLSYVLITMKYPKMQRSKCASFSPDSSLPQKRS